jgi:tetratricopeptide (TPR) repeat protein
VQCLYCGKGIGPIRQLRDGEFCSAAHRTKFGERFRQQLYEALAPEPAPATVADFIGQPPPAGGPAPSPILRILRRFAPAEIRPAIGAAVGVAAERPSWVYQQRPAAMLTRPAWRDSASALPLPPSTNRTAPLPVCLPPQRGSAAGAAPTDLVAGTPSSRPPAVAPRIAESDRPPRDSAALPDALGVPAPGTADLSAPVFRAAVPACPEPAAMGRMQRANHTAHSLPLTKITVPGAPSVPETVLQTGMSPAVIASQPRPLAARPLPGRRRESCNIGILLPKPPVSAQPLAAASKANPGKAFSLPEPLPHVVTHPVPVPLPLPAMASAPSCALAGSVEPGPMREAAGNRDPRVATAPSLSPALLPDARPNLSALPSGMLTETAPAPPLHADAPAPVSPPAAVLSWDASRVASPDHALVPLADIALPPINCLPPPAGAISGPAVAWRPDTGRAARIVAVLRTLRTVRVFNPVSVMDRIKVLLHDLADAERSMPFSPELSDILPARYKRRFFRRVGMARLSRSKWTYMGAMAAALLLAAVLRPQAAPKIAGASLGMRAKSIRQWMSQRATRTFADDFRTGLNQWKGVQPKPKSWSHSSDGFIHPGQLALYRPSVPLSDYRFEFMAQIENKSVDWVVRAKDADNYYAVKFTVLEAGPRPIMAMIHYPVIAGHRGARVLTPLRMMIHANTPYRVTLDVKGNRYRAFIEDQEADFWTDDKLKTGGVGFFSEAGERARVYWVKIESHGDILGRICGLLSGKGNGGSTNKELEAMDYRHAGTTTINAINAGIGPNGAETATNTAQETRISRVLSKAAALHLDGKLDDAAKELVRALDGGERHPALYFALGQLQYELQDYRPAAQSYEQAALLQPLHPTAHFNAGVCLGRIERWEDAAAAFRKAISNDPARAEAHLALGACLVQSGLHNEALEAYDRFLDRHPDHEEALFGKAVALQKRDRASEAVELYRRILNRSPYSEEALGNLISLALASQDYEQVRKYALRLAERQPKSQIALEGLAGAAFAAGDHKAAAEYSAQLAELAPQVFENWFNLGVACHKAGDLVNASKAYARATKVQPDSPQAHLNLGVALQEQGDLPGARAAYQRALQIDPKLAGVHWNLGLVHEQLGELADAEKLYAQVPPDSPDSDDAAFRIGHLRLERADHAGSIQAFEACLQKRPNWPEARLNLGISHWRAGDKEAARTCFQELTASGSDSKEALRGLAALSLEHQDYDKAFEIYRQLLDSGERSPELLYNAGLICQRRGEAEDAAVLYREAIKADPQFGEALLNLGHALMSLGNEFEARSCWRKAVIAKPELAQRYFEPAAQAS